MKREECAAIGRFIIERSDELIAEWEGASRRDHPEASEEQRSTLRNSLPEFLRAFGESLQQNCNDVPREHATRHGLQRWEIGWDISSLTRDFMILRRVLVSAAERNLEIGSYVAHELAATLDEAVAVSVSAYVDERERELSEKNEALHRKNYELKRFAHVVAHEIRNPIALIGLYTDALDRRLRSGDAADEYVEGLRSGIGSIAEIIDSLVEYADMGLADSGRETEVDLEFVFEEAKDSLRFLIDGSGATVERGPLPTVRGNEIPLRSLFANMIENAIKYSGDGPPHLRVAARECEDWWEIDFRDRGIGIAEEDRTRVFKFLTRLRNIGDIPGSGIGLAMCRRIAEQHGGEIRLDSALGEGSTFTLRLPRPAGG